MEFKNIINKYSDLMLKAEGYIWDNPEVGFKEIKTNEFMIGEFQKLGYNIEKYDDITGFWCYYDTGKKGPTVLILGELDALYCSGHADCDKQTGAAHVCGHNFQCASVLGVAAAVKDYAKNYDLCGKIKFCLVPAEEGVDISYRTDLINKKLLSFTSGKPEYISRGILSDVNVAYMIHTSNGEGRFEGGFYFDKGSNGVLRKKIEISGRAAHAGGKPWNGINALYAAELALSACNALRETFKESDVIRFHPIITKGGESVNAIPANVTMESYVRGANAAAIKDANQKINRAIACACAAMGAKVKIIDIHGSEPRLDDVNLSNLMRKIACDVVGAENCLLCNDWESSSTDMGDVSCLVPSVHCYVDAQRGLAHDQSYKRIDVKGACEKSATLQFATLIELLQDGAKKCYEIIDNYKPTYSSVEEYVKEKKMLSQSCEYVEYCENEIKIKN